MKKQFSLVLSLLSAMPFAFWDMGDRFTMKIDGHKGLTYNTKSIYPNTINYQKSKNRDMDDQCSYTRASSLYGNHVYSFLYDNHTNYVLLGLPDSYPENFHYFDDGLKNLSLAKTQLEVVPNGYYTMQSVENMLFTLRDELEIRKCIAAGTVGGAQEGLQKAINKGRLLNLKQLGLEKIISTDSGIKIDNEDGKVELKRNNLIVDLRDALMKHFSNHDANTTIASAISYLRSPNLTNNQALSKVLETIKAAKSIRVNDSIREGLRNSRILRVYNVLKDEDGKESILFGLAENLASQRKFFWITQLKDDLSILLKS